MHISDGILSIPILVIGMSVAAIGLRVGLKKMNYEHLPQTALLAATFFIASFISIPLGPVKVHLTLNGLLGIVLGWCAFPAFFVGLALQAILFQFGGLTTLGINTCNIAFPALFCFWFFGQLVRTGRIRLSALGGFFAGFSAVLGTSLLMSLALISAQKDFLIVVQFIIIAHLPIMVIEGLITAAIVTFLRRVYPAVLM